MKKGNDLKKEAAEMAKKDFETGQLYENVVKLLKGAKEYYEKAAKGGNEDAVSALKRLNSGKKLEKNILEF